MEDKEFKIKDGLEDEDTNDYVASANIRLKNDNLLKENGFIEVDGKESTITHNLEYYAAKNDVPEAFD